MLVNEYYNVFKESEELVEDPRCEMCAVEIDTPVRIQSHIFCTTECATRFAVEELATDAILMQYVREYETAFVEAIGKVLQQGDTAADVVREILRAFAASDWNFTDYIDYALTYEVA